MEIRAKQKNARARWRCYMFIYERCARRAQTCPRVPNLRTRPPVGLCVRHSATSPPCYLLSHDPHVSVCYYYVHFSSVLYYSIFTIGAACATARARTKENLVTGSREFVRISRGKKWSVRKCGR